MSKFLDFESTWCADRVPDHAQEAIENYLMLGFHPGGFMSAMFAGDLFRAAGCGDQANGPSMQGIAKWIMHSAPHGSWGSYELIEKWVKDEDGIRTNFRTQKEKEYVANALKA
jgi:hypothetical protein